MTLDIQLNSQSLRGVLSGPPSISDQLNGVCRSLAFTVKKVDGLENYLGQPIELWYAGKRWFFGFIFKKGITDAGEFSYTAYDPLYFMKKAPGDYYIKNMTATQGFLYLAAQVGIAVGPIAGTNVVFPALYYQNAEADKVAIDLLARTYQASGEKYWYRFEPGTEHFGLQVFPRIVPTEIWAFQVGVNLTAANYEASIEETATVVRLVNRETGKTVTKVNTEAIKSFGNLVHFEEVDKDAADTMDAKAQTLLDKLSVVKATMSIEGTNPYQAMPQLYSGDVIYVEESVTQLIGAYHILNVTQTFLSDNLVTLAMDIQEAPDIPVIQYEDATTDPATKSATAKTKAGTGVQENAPHSAAVDELITKYGL